MSLVSKVLIVLFLCGSLNAQMLVRISQVEVHNEFIDEYIKYAKAVAKSSVENESGVVAIYPMQMRENLNQFRILEIYATQKAYEEHIKTEHFLKYKNETLHMVKFLKLHDMNELENETMGLIFKKSR